MDLDGEIAGLRAFKTAAEAQLATAETTIRSLHERLLRLEAIFESAVGNANPAPAEQVAQPAEPAKIGRRRGVYSGFGPAEQVRLEELERAVAAGALEPDNAELVALRKLAKG